MMLGQIEKCAVLIRNLQIKYMFGFRSEPSVQYANIFC